MKGLILLLVFVALCSAKSTSWTLTSIDSDTPVTYQWSDATKWSAGVPVDGDDVTISGDAWVAAKINLIISLGTSITLNSLTFGGPSLGIQGTSTSISISITSNFIFEGGMLSSLNLNLLTGATGSFSSSSAICTLNNLNVNTATTVTVTFSSPYCVATNTVITNAISATWTWNAVGYFYNGLDQVTVNGNKITNLGSMSIVGSSFQDSPEFYADWVNSGSLSVSAVTAAIATKNLGLSWVAPFPVFNNSGTISIMEDAEVYFAQTVTINLLAGHQVMGDGTLNLYAGSTTGEVITVNALVNANIENLITEGRVSLLGPGQYNIGNWTYRGATITPATKYIAEWMTIEQTWNPASSHNFKLNTNISVTDHLLLNLGLGLDVVEFYNDASLVVESTATCSLRMIGMEGTGKFVNYGTLSSVSADFLYSQFRVPIYNFGSITIVEDSSIILYGGLYNYGQIVTPAHYLPFDPNDIEFQVGGASKAFAGSSFSGGYFYNSGGEGCANVNNPGCNTSGTFTFESSSTIPFLANAGGGTILAPSGVIVTLNNATFYGGKVKGPGNTVVKYGWIEQYGSVPLSIDNTQLVIDGNFWVSGQIPQFMNNGIINITTNGNFYVNKDLIGDSGGATTNIYNSGEIIVENKAYCEMEIDNGILNNGVISQSCPTVGEGAQFDLYGSLAQTSNGIIEFNIFGSQKFDTINIFQEAAPCAFSGGIRLIFASPPTVGATYNILQYQKQSSSPVATQCNGRFTVTATGLGAGQTANIFYDIPYLSSYFNAQVRICSSSDSACTAQQQAGSGVTSTGTSSQSTTQSQSTSADSTTTGGSSSASHSPLVFLSFILCVSCLLLLVQ